MKVYIAAPYPLRSEARDLGLTLRNLGHHVTSRWLLKDDDSSDATAQMDLDDVDRADVLLLWQPGEWANKGTGGRHVEFGYALAIGKPVVVFGSKTNVFHYLDRVRVTERLEDL